MPLYYEGQNYLFTFPFDQAFRLSSMGTITISTITTAISMIPSVEPASGRTSGVAMVVVVIGVGVMVIS